MNLRSATIRLAHAKPELRKHLLPILAKGAPTIPTSVYSLLQRKGARRALPLFQLYDHLRTKTELEAPARLFNQAVAMALHTLTSEPTKELLGQKKSAVLALLGKKEMKTPDFVHLNRLYVPLLVAVAADFGVVIIPSVPQGNEKWVSFKFGGLSPIANPLFDKTEVNMLPGEALQPHKDAKQLFAHAAEAHELQLDFLDRGKGLAAAIGAVTVRGDLREKAPSLDTPGPLVMIGPMKKLERSSEKVNKDYKGDWSKLNDVVRSSIAVDTYDEVPALLKKLLSSGVKLARKPKDRFYKATAAGYRDVLLNVVYPNGHVGEIQVHVKSMLKAKEQGHHFYNEVRKIEGVAEAEGRRDLTPEEQDIVDNANAKAQALYQKAWAEARGGNEAMGKKAAVDPRTTHIQYFQYGDFPAMLEHQKFPVVYTLSGPQTLYSTEKFFREASPITEKQFKLIRMRQRDNT